MAKSKSPAFQFYPADWLSSASVSLMTPAEEGAYVRLLCIAWLESDCGLPDDDAALSVLSRLGKQWAISGIRIRAKFRPEGGRLFNDRLLRERDKQAEWSRKSSEGGKRSVATKRQPNVNGGSMVVDECLQPNVNSSSSTTSSSSQTTTTPSSPQLVEFPRFSEFPKTDAAVRRRFSGADLRIVLRIIEAATQAFLSVKSPKIPELTDQDIADAVDQAAGESPRQTSAALFLSTVPNVVKSWAELGRHPPGSDYNPNDARYMTQEKINAERKRRGLDADGFEPTV